MPKTLTTIESTLLACLLLLGGIGAFPLGLQAQIDTLKQSAEENPPPVPQLGTLSALQGLTITKVELRGLPIKDANAAGLNDLAGKPLDRQKIRNTVRDLYGSGRFSDIQVDAQRAGAGVSLAFVTRPNYFVGKLDIGGAPRRPSAAQLLDSTRLELGELLTRAKLDQAMSRIKSVMAENGYYRASVTETETIHAENQIADVVFRLDPGEPAKVGKLVIQGDAGFSPEEIGKIARLEPGHTVTSDRLTKALQRLRNKYSKAEHLEAQVSVVDRVYHAEDNTVEYVFHIVRGPAVDIRVEGAGISRGKIKRLIPVYEENAVDDDLLNEGRRNIRDYLQTKGFFDVEATFTKETAANDDLLHIVYRVERGSKHELLAVQIEGNKYFEDATLRERLQIQPKNWLLSYGKYSQELLNQDVDNLVALYRSNGFQQVQITSDSKDNFEGKEGNLVVAIQINEGPQTLVSKLTLDGNATIPAGQLEPLLSNTEGQPYSEANVARDRDALLDYYFNQGFPAVEIDTVANPDPSTQNHVNVVYTITEGKRVFVERVILSDLRYTQPQIVHRELQVHEGDPLSQAEMLSTQRRLYDLGVFNEVRMAVQNPDGQAQYKDVMVRLQEARRWTFNYGLGLEASTGVPGAGEGGLTTTTSGATNSSFNPEGKTGVSPRVSFDVTRINFRGRAHTILFSTHLGELEQRGLMSYDAPRFWGSPNLRLTLTAFYDNSINVTTFTSQRLEGSVALEQIASKITKLQYRFIYRRVRAADVHVSPDLIPILSVPVRVGMPNFSYIRDKRDDPLDSHTGNYTTFDTGLASSVFGSEASFGRFLIQNSTYHAFKKKKWVFARSLRIGVEEPFSSTVIPLPERFLAGGANILRGFGLNQAGPRDLQTGAPLGGNALLANSLELRFPPLTLPFVADNLSFVAFHDVGNVFDSGQSMVKSVFRWYQPGKELCRSASTASQCGFNYMSSAIGGGVRYRTPIGPVRVDVGYNLNPTSYPTFTTDSVGNQTFVPRTTHRVNFYFSIGQTF